MFIFVKNILDIIFSLCLSFIIAPILIFSMILIKFETKGPVFFTQDRVGKDGVIFKIFKLRTMKHNNQQMLFLEKRLCKIHRANQD